MYVKSKFPLIGFTFFVTSILIVLTLSTTTVAAAAKQKPGTIKINALTQKKCWKTRAGEPKCTFKKSKQTLIVREVSQAAEGWPNANAKCNGKKISGETIFGSTRTLKCTPGYYSVTLLESKPLKQVNAQSSEVVHVTPGSNKNVRLGSER